MTPTCLHDDNLVAGPGESLCAACLATEQAGVALPNNRRHDRWTTRR